MQEAQSLRVTESQSLKVSETQFLNALKESAEFQFLHNGHFKVCMYS